MAQQKESFELANILIPCFTGEGSVVNVHEFLEKIDLVGDLQNWSEDTKLKFARLKLYGKASLAVKYCSKFKDCDWGKFKTELKCYYYYSIPGFHMGNVLKRCNQWPGETLKDFTWRFLHTVDRCGRFYVGGMQSEEEEKKVRRDYEFRTWLWIYLEKLDMDEDDRDAWYEDAGNKYDTLCDIINEIYDYYSRMNNCV